MRRTLVMILGLWATTVAAAPAPPRRAPEAPAASYLEALRVADLFLGAWARRDVDGGLALVSAAVIDGESGGRAELRGGVAGYLSGVSNPHHEAFEIGPGRQVVPDRYSFPVRLFELYLGESTGVAYGDTLEVVRQGGEWRVDRLPRSHDPD
ncbi:MAG: hypothetical protein ACYDIE_01365 [Candidatus Krumholzibacteriia bacterium]